MLSDEELLAQIRRNPVGHERLLFWNLILSVVRDCESSVTVEPSDTESVRLSLTLRRADGHTVSLDVREEWNEGELGYHLAELRRLHDGVETLPMPRIFTEQ